MPCNDRFWEFRSAAFDLKESLKPAACLSFKRRTLATPFAGCSRYTLRLNAPLDFQASDCALAHG
jgi:hypothetical protein